MVCKHRWYLVAIRRRKLIIIWEVLFISDFYTVKYICSNLCMWECLMKKILVTAGKSFFTSQLQKTSIPLRKNVFLIVVKCQVFWLRWKLRYFNLGCALTNSKKHTSWKNSWIILVREIIIVHLYEQNYFWFISSWKWIGKILNCFILVYIEETNSIYHSS